MYFSQSHSGSIMCESVSAILYPSLIFLSQPPANSGKVSLATTAQYAYTAAHPGLYASRDENGYPPAAVALRAAARVSDQIRLFLASASITSAAFSPII